VEILPGDDYKWHSSCLSLVLILEMFFFLQIEPYVPLAFTAEGMLARLAFQIEKQEFCAGILKPVWPPISALQVKRKSR